MDQAQIAATQDALRPFRQFVSLISGIVGEQTWASQDGYAGSMPYGYQSIGPYGWSVEGAPVSVTRAGGVVISPMVVMIGLGVVATLILKR